MLQFHGFGLIQIIKTFIISQSQHIISVMDIPEFHMKQIVTIIYNFVWNGKMPVGGQYNACFSMGSIISYALFAARPTRHIE